MVRNRKETTEKSKKKLGLSTQIFIALLAGALLGVVIHYWIPSSYIKDTVGVLPNILNTLYIIVAAMVIVLPLGVGGRRLSDGVRRQPPPGGRHRVCHRDPDGHPLHHLRPGGYAAVRPADEPSSRHPGRRPDAGGDDPAHHRPHHPGEPENRAPRPIGRGPWAWGRGNGT